MKFPEYVALRHSATILRDGGNYNPAKGQTNPVIFEEFVELVLDKELPPVVWEPFAGHEGRSESQDFCEDLGVKLVSFDIAPSDPRVIEADSTIEGPGEPVGGMIFHPPYFGSSVMSDALREISLTKDQDEYILKLKNTARLGLMGMAHNGIVCAVCRRYRHGGKDIRLDEWFLEIFYEYGMILRSVWSSEPDIVLVLEKP